MRWREGGREELAMAPRTRRTSRPSRVSGQRPPSVLLWLLLAAGSWPWLPAPPVAEAQGSFAGVFDSLVVWHKLNEASGATTAAVRVA